MLRRGFLAIALACIAGLAHAADPARVLFIGNSLTFHSDIPRRVAALAKAMGKTVHVESVAFPAFSLEDHWKDGRALKAIQKGWDVVVLQQGTSAHKEGREQLIEYAKRFAGPIREAKARPAMYMVWPLSTRPRDFPETIRAYRDAAQAIDAILIPVGEAWLRAMTKDRRLRLDSDGIHQSSLGSDLTVLTIWFSLFPAGPREFDEAYVEKIARQLELVPARRDAFFDAATRAIDEPMELK